MNVFNGYGTISRLTAGTETNSVKGDFSGLYYFYDRIVKELSLINTYDFHIGCYLQHACRRADWS
jgi:hypothetical protein